MTIGFEASGLPADVRRYIDTPSRLRALADLEAVPLNEDPDLNRLTVLAAGMLDAPIGLLTLVGSEQQVFKARQGTSHTGTPTEISFCAHALAAGDGVMIVEDATADDRFSGNPLVVGGEHLRFYAGVPVSVAGEQVGTLCLLDRKPRPRPSETQLEQLRSLAQLASTLLSLKRNARTGVLAHAALERDQARRSIALQAAGLASWVWDVKADHIECDALMLGILDLDLESAAPLAGEAFFKAIDRRDVNHAEASFRNTLLTSDECMSEFRVRNIDPARWVSTRGRVIERDADGRPLLIFGVTYDISDRRSSDERQRLLLRELNHRVKNTLATVQALASQTVRHVRDPRQFLEAFSGRLQALGLAHGLLSDHEWRGLKIGDLVRREVLPFDDVDDPRIDITGSDLLLTPDQALGLGLILHELASNAMKYGSLSVPTGRVALRWRVDGADEARRVVLNWEEIGGPTVNPPERHGFGSILIRRSLAKVLSSEVMHDFAPAGVKAEISLPFGEPEPAGSMAY